MRGGLFGCADIELTQVRKFGEATTAACAQNGIGPHRANPWDTQQLVPACLHNINGSFSQVPLRPGPLRIEFELHISITHEWQILYLPPIITQQKTGLIQAVLTERISSRQVFKGSLNDWAEAGIIGACQPIVSIETIAERE